jgi:hypothetical protein
MEGRFQKMPKLVADFSAKKTLIKAKRIPTQCQYVFYEPAYEYGEIRSVAILHDEFQKEEAEPQNIEELCRMTI